MFFPQYVLYCTAQDCTVYIMLTFRVPMRAFRSCLPTIWSTTSQAKAKADRTHKMSINNGYCKSRAFAKRDRTATPGNRWPVRVLCRIRWVMKRQALGQWSRLERSSWRCATMRATVHPHKTTHVARDWSSRHASPCGVLTRQTKVAHSTHRTCTSRRVLCLLIRFQRHKPMRAWGSFTRPSAACQKQHMPHITCMRACSSEPASCTTPWHEPLWTPICTTPLSRR